MTTMENSQILTSPLTCCPRSTVKRAAARARYDRKTAYELIDRLKTGHVGFVEDGEPRIIPITVWRLDDDLYIHTLNGGRMSRCLDSGALLCSSFAVTSEWVMSKRSEEHTSELQSRENL